MTRMKNKINYITETKSDSRLYFMDDDNNRSGMLIEKE